MSFLNSLSNYSKKYEDPFLHWELNKPLTDEQINEIINAEIANPIEHKLLTEEKGYLEKVSQTVAKL